MLSDDQIQAAIAAVSDQFQALVKDLERQHKPPGVCVGCRMAAVRALAASVGLNPVMIIPSSEETIEAVLRNMDT